MRTIDFPRVSIAAVTEDSWCLHDAARGEHDPDRVIAYVERSGDGVEVVWVRHPHPVQRRFARLEDAYRAAEETALVI